MPSSTDGARLVRHGPYLTMAESCALVDDIDRWCLSTNTNYNRLVVAAGVGPSVRSMVRTKGRRLTVLIAMRIRTAMRDNPEGIERIQHKQRLARSTEITVRPDDIELRRVNRDPCPRCGVRADIGCAHSRRGFEHQALRA